MFLYRLLSGLALMAYAPVALLQSLTGRRKLGDVRGRLGKARYPDLSGGTWIHAVSVGEVGVARSLIPALAKHAPGLPLGLSVTTAAGRQLAERTWEGRIPVFAFPFDLPRPVEAALSSVRPALVLLTETEIWPLFLQRAAESNIPVALVNGRISARSFARYRFARRFLAGTLEKISLFAMQSAEDAERIAALGAAPARLHVTGNIKYDLPAAAAFADALRLRAAAEGRPLLVAASTGEGEEKIVLEAWRPIASRAFLALAPRRPERFESVARLVETAGFSVIRRSRSGMPMPIAQSEIPVRPSVYLLDSIGELASLYREASLTLIGGSFVSTGGHNPIESWAQGVPVVTGPHMQNFRQIAERGEAGGFLKRAPDERRLAAELARWAANPSAEADRGERARLFVAANRGAAERTVELVLPLLQRAAHRQRATP